MKISKGKYSLGTKIFAYFFILAGAILVLTQVIFNFSLDTHLTRYLEEREKDVNRQIAQSFLSCYQERQNWAGCQMIVYHTAMSTNTQLVLLDSNENTLLDSRQGMRMMGRMAAQEPFHFFQAEDFHYILPLEYQDEAVGTLYIRYPSREQGVWQPQDQDLRQVLGQSLMFTGLLAALTAFGMSLLFSRRLAGPLETMAKAANRIGKGDLTVQLPDYDASELQELAQSLNVMAKKLEALEALRRRSTADLSHELRTPLTTLKSYFEAFNDGVIPLDKETIRTLQEEVVQLSRLVEEMDELSRAEGSTGDDQKKEMIHLKNFLQEKTAFFQSLAQGKKQELTVLLPENEVMVYQDPSSLSRMLGNLLANASSYTPAGGMITVDLKETVGRAEDRSGFWGVHIEPGNQDAAYAVISIRDTGVGIKEEDLPFIFERFFRADISRERPPGGSGIGLALVKELVRTAGGAIYVESKWGEGTLFELFLPRV